MAWGGSLNPDGSDYVRKIREAEKVIDFLNNLKKELNKESQKNIQETIKIIEDYVLDLSENSR